MMLKAFDSNLEAAGEIPAPGVFAGRANMHVLHLAHLKERANARVGSASTKTRGEVRGGGRKPRRQKHTGMSRQGSIRAPHWRGGGIVFGPRPRKYRQDLPAAVRRLALRTVIAAKMNAGEAIVLERMDLPEPKTKAASQALTKLSLESDALLVIPAEAPVLRQAFRNMPSVRVCTAATVSVNDLLGHRHLVILKEALDLLARRCGEGRD